MISDAINSAAADVWAKVYYVISFSFLDPFWGWLCIGITIILAVSAICWFFGGWFPVLRPIGGVIVLLIGAMLYAYRRGANEARAHDKAKNPKPKPKIPPPTPRDRWPFG